MQTLPKDPLTVIALELDLPSLISFCRSSKQIDEKICKDDTFWLNKVIKDFGLIVDKTKAKRKYFEISNKLKGQSLEYLISNEIDDGDDLEMIQVAVYKGADLKKKEYYTFKIFLRYDLTPLIAALVKNRREIVRYLLDKSLTSKESCVEELNIFFNITNEFRHLNKFEKCNSVFLLYDLIFPYIIEKKYLEYAKHFWNITYKKLNILIEEGGCEKLREINQELYRKMAE